MKKVLPLMITIILSGAFVISCAQDKEKKDIKKEIRVENENGNTTVTITETENGKVTKKVLTGEEAEKYMEEKNESGQNGFFFTDDEGGEKQIIIVEENSDNGDGDHMVWVSDEDGDMHFNTGMSTDEITGEIEQLQKEIDDLSKEEISKRLEEILKNNEELERDMMVKMETINQDMGNVKVNVEEDDGIVTIEKTVNGKTTVKTIKMDDSERVGSNVYIIKTSENDNEEDIERTEKSLSGHINNMNLNVYPNPNSGSFTIEMDLKSDKDATVSVVDSNGKEVYNKVVKGAKKHKLNVKVKDSQNGMYIVTVKQGDEIMKLKTMVE